MKATYIKTRPKSVVNVSQIVTIHDYEFDKTFRFAVFFSDSSVTASHVRIALRIVRVL